MYPHVVRTSVTLVHPAKAVGRNEMPFGKDTRVAPSNVVIDGGPGPQGRLSLSIVGDKCARDNLGLLKVSQISVYK